MNYHIDIRLKLSNKGYTFLDFIQGRKHHRVQVHASIRTRSFLDTGFWGVYCYALLYHLGQIDRVLIYSKKYIIIYN